MQSLQVLIQKTGTFNPTQLAALTAVPPGVTVTPARTLATNISIRKVQPVSSSRPMPSASTSSSSSSALVAMGDTIQTSPDSTRYSFNTVFTVPKQVLPSFILSWLTLNSHSHEDSYGDSSNAARGDTEGQGDNGLPDSQVAIQLSRI